MWFRFTQDIKNGAHYYPITLGHEFSGYIVRWDPVLMIYTPAMRLPVCRITLFYLSRVSERVLFPVCKIDFIGSRRDGGFAEYIVVKRTMSLHYLRICLLRMALLLNRYRWSACVPFSARM